MRVVVTGATGNVGTSVVRALTGDKLVDQVIGLARRPPPDGTLDAEWRQVDVSRDELADSFQNADAVAHLAWVEQPTRMPAYLHEINVRGSTRVFEAAAAARVGTLLYASSSAAYSPAPPGTSVDEAWPRDGVPTSTHSRQKAEVERLLDEFEEHHPLVRVVRIRSAMALKSEAASGFRRKYLGGVLALAGASLARLSVLPDVPGLATEVVHSDDLAEAYRLALFGSVTGAYNVAAGPALDGIAVADHLGLHPVRVRADIARKALAAGWKMRLHSFEPGWIDLAIGSGALDTGRAREELDWKPVRTGYQVLTEMSEGLRAGAGFPTPPLQPSRQSAR